MVDGRLIIGAQERASLAMLREQAARAPVHMPALVEAMKTAQGSLKHRQQMQRQSLAIPTRYFLCFSIETGHGAGTCRHMSLSSTARGRVPTLEAVWMLAEELGFVGGLDTCSVWIEDLSDGGKAVNVVQPLSVTAPQEDQAHA